MEDNIKTLLEYAFEEKSKYTEVYNYIEKIINPVEPSFINQEVLFANINQLYNRAKLLEEIINRLIKKEGNNDINTRKLF